MVIQHNLHASYTNLMIGITTSEKAKSAEKLASGYKINRAADNAACLSISEKMRKQMQGLSRASTNGTDGISFVQIADGALNEVHEMLQRGNELAVQAANGTLSDGDRKAIDDEIKQLKREINAITSRTKFNETNVFCKEGYLPRFNELKPHASLTAGIKNLAKKISDEYFPNAIEQILGSFSAIGSKINEMAEENSTQFDTTLNLDTIDGVSNILAQMSAHFTISSQQFVAGSLLMEVDKEDFPSLNLSSYDMQMLESTIAHEVMHGVMHTVFPSRMYQNTSQEDFPKWFVEGTAQLAGGGFTTGWNDTLINRARNLTDANDNSADAQIKSYLSQGGDYTVDNRVYGHGYLAAAYACYLAADSDDFSLSNLLDGANKIFQAFIDDNTESFGTILADKIGISEDALKNAINSGSTTSPVTGKMSAVEFVRRLSYESRNGAGSFITDNLGVGGTNILGESAQKDEQPLKILTTRTGHITFNLDENSQGHSASIALHVGSDANMTNKMEVYLFDMSTDALLLTDTNLLTADNATDAIDDFSNAITMVNGVRSYFGAIQNRIEHTILNLDNVVENTTAAESRIRDTDIADEMISMATSNILQQAGQAMLTQANQLPQGVMSLIQ